MSINRFILFFTVVSILWICADGSICNEQKKVGPCRARIPRYYYNKDTGDCERFFWGGCRSNGNNFRTASRCKSACQPKAPEKVENRESGYGFCSEPKKVGPCRARIPRYYYNENTGVCEKFNWGGCMSNGNNFRTISRCKSACKSKAPRIVETLNPVSASARQTFNKICVTDQQRPRLVCTSTQSDVCRAPKKVGPCRARIPRYYFNEASGTCERFMWGGCRPNRNNFRTSIQCVFACELQPQNENVCEQPKSRGPCFARIPRYFFNQATGNCEKFFWGGCRANENNFETETQCYNKCKKAKIMDTQKSSVCDEPKAVFIACAQSPTTRYYFNKSNGQCELFTWYGCARNGNNFESLSKCISVCGGGGYTSSDMSFFPFVKR